MILYLNIPSHSHKLNILITTEVLILAGGSDVTQPEFRVLCDIWALPIGIEVAEQSRIWCRTRLEIPAALYPVKISVFEESGIFYRKI